MSNPLSSKRLSPPRGNKSSAVQVANTTAADMNKALSNLQNEFSSCLKKDPKMKTIICNSFKAAIKNANSGGLFIESSSNIPESAQVDKTIVDNVTKFLDQPENKCLIAKGTGMFSAATSEYQPEIQKFIDFMNNEPASETLASKTFEASQQVKHSKPTEIIRETPAKAINLPTQSGISLPIDTHATIPTFQDCQTDKERKTALLNAMPKLKSTVPLIKAWHSQDIQSFIDNILEYVISTDNKERSCENRALDIINQLLGEELSISLDCRSYILQASASTSFRGNNNLAHPLHKDIESSEQFLALDPDTVLEIIRKKLNTSSQIPAELYSKILGSYYEHDIKNLINITMEYLISQGKDRNECRQIVVEITDILFPKYVSQADNRLSLIEKSLTPLYAQDVKKIEKSPVVPKNNTRSTPQERYQMSVDLKESANLRQEQNMDNPNNTIQDSLHSNAILRKKTRSREVTLPPRNFLRKKTGSRKATPPPRNFLRKKTSTEHAPSSIKIPTSHLENINKQNLSKVLESLQDILVDPEQLEKLSDDVIEILTTNLKQAKEFLKENPHAFDKLCDALKSNPNNLPFELILFSIKNAIPVTKLKELSIGTIENLKEHKDQAVSYSYLYNGELSIVPSKDIALLDSKEAQEFLKENPDAFDKLCNALKSNPNNLPLELILLSVKNDIPVTKLKNIGTIENPKEHKDQDVSYYYRYNGKLSIVASEDIALLDSIEVQEFLKENPDAFGKLRDALKSNFNNLPLELILLSVKNDIPVTKLKGLSIGTIENPKEHKDQDVSYYYRYNGKLSIVASEDIALLDSIEGQEFLKKNPDAFDKLCNALKSNPNNLPLELILLSVKNAIPVTKLKELSIGTIENLKEHKDQDVSYYYRYNGKLSIVASEDIALLDSIEVQEFLKENPDAFGKLRNALKSNPKNLPLELILLSVKNDIPVNELNKVSEYNIADLTSGIAQQIFSHDSESFKQLIELLTKTNVKSNSKIIRDLISSDVLELLQQTPIKFAELKSVSENNIYELASNVNEVKELLIKKPDSFKQVCDMLAKYAKLNVVRFILYCVANEVPENTISKLSEQDMKTLDYTLDIGESLKKKLKEKLEPK